MSRRRYEDRRPVPAPWDRHGDVSHAWKAEFGGMDVSEAKRLKALEDENAKPKRLLADAILDASVPKDLLEKGDARSTIRYPSRQSDDAVLRGRLRDFATGRRRFASPLAVGRLLAIAREAASPRSAAAEGLRREPQSGPSGSSARKVCRVAGGAVASERSEPARRWPSRLGRTCAGRSTSSTTRWRPVSGSGCSTSSTT